MSVPLDQEVLRMKMEPQMTTWTIEVSDVRTVKVSNISLAAMKQDILEFFSFSGEIQYVELRSESERSQQAYVTFKDSQGADTALLLTGATIVDLSVTIVPVEGYQLPPEAYKTISGGNHTSGDSTIKKAEDVVSSMLAKGFILGKDALKRAKSFDERHHLISNASATISSLDRKIGLTEKITLGTAVVSGKVRDVDERFQVSEITKSAYAAAEQTVSVAGSAIMSSSYISSGASWLSSAFSKVVNLAGDVSQMTKQKVEKAEDERRETLYLQRTNMVNDYAKVHLDESSSLGEPPTVPVDIVEDRTLTIL